MLELIIIVVSLIIILQYKYGDMVVDLVQNIRGVRTEVQDSKEHIYKNGFTRTNGALITDQSKMDSDKKNGIKNGDMFVKGGMYKRRSSYPNLLRLNSANGRFKSFPSVAGENPYQRPLMGLACSRCVPCSKKLFVDKVTPVAGIRNMLDVPTSQKDHSFLTRRFSHLAYVSQINTNFQYEDISKEVLATANVQSAIEKACEQDQEEMGDRTESLYQTLSAKHTKKAVFDLNGMKAKIKRTMIKIAGFVLLKVFGKLLDAILVHKGQIEMIKAASETSEEYFTQGSAIPIIYIPMHRNHLDYLLITFILFCNGIRAPMVAAGDNLRIPVFQRIMRGLGAFYIKRKLDPKVGKKDFVYRAILQTYMERSLGVGNSMEFFIEGGRSRSGKCCMPKGGLLSIVVDACMDGTIDDAFIVPVAISYDKLIDMEILDEQLGKSKVDETFTSIIKAIWHTVNLNYGTVRVDFAQPFSLGEFVQSAQSITMARAKSPNNFLSHIPKSCPAETLAMSRKYSSTASLYGADVADDDKRLLVKSLAEHVVYDCSQATGLMCTNLLALLLLNKHRNGVTMPTLIEDFNDLRNDLFLRRRDVGFSGGSAEAIMRAVKLLGKHLVSMEKKQISTVKNTASDGEMLDKRDEPTKEVWFLKPNVSIPAVIELMYYSNVALSPFVIESVVVNALCTVLDIDLDLLRNSSRKGLAIVQQTLVDKAYELADIMQFEFILVPWCYSLEDAIIDVINKYIVSEDLKVGNRHRGYKNDIGLGSQMSKFNEDSESEDDNYESERVLLLSTDDDTLDKLGFHRSIIASYVESYWHVATNLEKLLDGKDMEEKKFIKMVDEHIRERVNKGLVLHSECVATESLKGALKLMEAWRVVGISTRENVRILYLQPDYSNLNALKSVVKTIGQFKK